VSDIPTAVPGTPAGTPVEDGDPLSPPDDLGASVLAEFERRTKATAAPANDTAVDGPPGGFPDLDDAAAKVTARVDVSKAVDQATSPTAVAQSAANVDETATGTSSTSGDAASDPGGSGAASSTGTDTATVTDDGAGAVEPGDGSAVEATPPPGYTWTYNDGVQDHTVTFDDAQVQGAIRLAAWAEALPDEVKTAVGLIESGQSIAIPRSEFDEFSAWKAQQHRSTRDADLENADMDPAVADIIRKQRDEIDALKAGQPQVPGSVDPVYQAQVNAGAERTMAEFNAATTAYAEARQLTPEETQGLLGVAIQAEIIPHLVQANTRFNPANGQVLVPADMTVVAEQALDWALVRNPHLKTRVLSAQQPANGQITPGAQPPAGIPAAPDPVQARKARAGSLATAPSGAAPPVPPQTVRQMTQPEVAAAMARDLEAILKS